MFKTCYFLFNKLDRWYYWPRNLHGRYMSLWPVCWKLSEKSMNIVQLIDQTNLIKFYFSVDLWHLFNHQKALIPIFISTRYLYFLKIFCWLSVSWIRLQKCIIILFPFRWRHCPQDVSCDIPHTSSDDKTLHKWIKLEVCLGPHDISTSYWFTLGKYI